MSKILMRALADILYQTRRELGLSQEKMAEKCCKSYREYNDLENAKRLPSIQTFIYIIITCDLNVNLIIQSLIERGYIPNDDRNSA